jgi:aryl-alcohol dehydrogenase-like predicted oxidoreductase
MPELLQRPLGSTGEMVSALGLGGFHLAEHGAGESEAIHLVRRAIDEGITFLDNSWDYNDGESERRMGKALRNGYRDRAFLMTKVDGRTRAAAASQIDESLERLQTDVIDLLQFHEIIRLEDAGRIFAPGGAIEAGVAARAAGKIRYIGFTGHKSPEIHLHMLAEADAHGFAFDAVQMPLNVMDAHFASFERNVLPELVRRGIGVLAMKTFGDHFILDAGLVTPLEMLHYSLTLPTSVVITGIDSIERLEQALVAARTFTPLSHERIEALLAKTAQAAIAGQHELYKTSEHFDSTKRSPQWLGLITCE